ncbi:MAG: helix-turn-helix domain-containing protein [Nocardioides sp.]
MISLESLDPVHYLVAISDSDARLVVSAGARRLHQVRERTTPSSREILDAWRRHGSAARVAQHLHCHPNTVLNRLRAVATLTGSDPRRPGELLRLVTELAILDRHEASGSASVSPAD